MLVISIYRIAHKGKQIFDSSRIRKKVAICVALQQTTNYHPSLYINDLISELKAVNSGISISDLNIPAFLLADDTTLLSTSANGLQRLLDCVQNYACRWRLTYNGTKSCLMLFDGHK